LVIGSWNLFEIWSLVIGISFIAFVLVGFSMKLSEQQVVYPRRKTRQVWVGRIPIGGGAPVSIQSMVKTDPLDFQVTVKQIKELEEAGCEIVRIAVPNARAAALLDLIKEKIQIPLVADIHFDHRLALLAIEKGVDKLRLNPGNIGARWKVEEVVKSAKDKKIPIRIGVNSGSLEKDLLKKYGHPTPEALTESALRHVEILEELGFQDIVISLKGSDILKTIEAYRLMAKKVDYPFHLGITASGPLSSGIIRSVIGIGTLLAEGIGDTIRVSLTGDPVEEVKVGFELLKSFHLREDGPIIISCPTCGRCEIDLIPIVSEVERLVRPIKKPLKIAVMGCVVNGPGEAREADLGIAGGKRMGLLFRKGVIIKKVREEEIVKSLVEEVERVVSNR